MTTNRLMAFDDVREEREKGEEGLRSGGDNSSLQ